jgi:hypothetical protein
MHGAEGRQSGEAILKLSNENKLRSIAAAVFLGHSSNPIFLGCINIYQTTVPLCRPPHANANCF